jgi:hypothetical protein
MDQTSLFFQTGAGSLDIEQLPDGSMAIYDRRSKSVHSLNRSASILWEACARGATMPQLTEALNARLSIGAVEDDVASWIDQMRQLDLLVSEAAMPAPEPKRRSLLALLGGTLPVVLTLTAAEQLAYSKQSAGSEGGGFTTTFGATTTSAPHTTTFMMTTTSSP